LILMSEQVITNLLLGSNFIDFKKKLEQDYAKPVKKIQFKDDEGDFITITSDLELMEARKLCSNEFKIVFEEEVPIKSQEFSSLPVYSESGPVVHSAYCDNCQATIVGIRYKCANCVDYDLCDQCEAGNSEGDIHHLDHVFLKIYRPVNYHIPFMIQNLYKVNENSVFNSNQPSRYDRFHSGAVSCPYIKSLEARLEIVEKELEEVLTNLNKNNEQNVNKERVDKERKQAEKRKENQLRKQVKQQRRRSKKLLKQQQKILNLNPSIVINEKDIVSQVKIEEKIPEENVSILQEPQSIVEENDSEPRIEDFEDLICEEEKQPIEQKSEPLLESHPISRYERQHSVLASMGFMDRNLNESLLVQFKDVYRVIDELVD